MQREKLIGFLWPERDSEHARNLLNQAVHAIRSALGEAVILSRSDELWLDPRILACDLVAFREAIATHDLEQAVALHRGPLLDGFFLPGSVAFERWMERERRRVRDRFRWALEELALDAGRREDGRRAVEHWRRLAADDPFSSRTTLCLMRALESTGNRAAAIEVARRHAARLEEELEAEPDPAVAALAERMRTAPRAHTALADAAPSTRSAHARAASAAPRLGIAARARASPRRSSPATGVWTTTGLAALVLAGLTGLLQTRPAPPTGDVTADQYVQRATGLSQVTRAGNEEAARLLRLALEADPRNARAWAELATVYGRRSPSLGFPTRALDSAIVFARRALDLAPGSAAAVAALAVTYGHQGLLEKEEEMARLALRLDPSGSLAARRLAESYRERGDFPQALRYHRTSVLLSPNDRTDRTWVGHVYADVRDYASAERWYRGVLQLDPEQFAALEGMAELYVARAMPDSARRYALRLVSSHPTEPAALAAAAGVYHHLREFDRAERFAARAVELAAGAPVRSVASTLATTMLGFAELQAGDTAQATRSFEQSLAFLRERLAGASTSPRLAYEAALIRAVRGDRLGALDLLERAYAQGFRWLWMLESDPMLDALRSEPRFADLLVRVRTDVAAMRRGIR